MVRKVPKFHGASANGFWYRIKNYREGPIRPPPTSNRVKVNGWQEVNLMTHAESAGNEEGILFASRYFL